MELKQAEDALGKRVIVRPELDGGYDTVGTLSEITANGSHVIITVGTGRDTTEQAFELSQIRLRAILDNTLKGEKDVKKRDEQAAKLKAAEAALKAAQEDVADLRARNSKLEDELADLAADPAADPAADTAAPADQP